MKKVRKYLLITFLLLTGLFFVGLLFLFFVPTSSILGITFINYNDRYISKDYNIDLVDKIVVNSRSYDIELVAVNSASCSIRVESHSLGYVLEKNSKVKLEEDLSNGVLTFTLTEPYGAAFKNNSLITLYIPKSKAVNLNLKNKNANTKIDNTDLKIKNLSYTAEDGVVNLKKATILGKLNLNLNKTDFRISSESTLNSCNVDLQVTTGSFDASKSRIGEINILSNERGVILLNNCSAINQSKQTTGGRLQAKKVNTISFSGSDTNLKINEVLTRASIKLTSSGKVTIEKLSGIADIVTDSGSIKIKNCTNNLTSLTLLSKSGNVEVNNAYNKVFVETSSGNIYVNYSENAGYANSSNQNIRYFKALTKTGKIVAKGVNRTDIEIKKDGSAEISYERFNSNQNLISNIKSNDGNVYIKVNNTSAFILNSKTNSGNSRINLTQTEKYKGWTNKEIQNKTINCTSNTNFIHIVTDSGNILMHDNNVN